MKTKAIRTPAAALMSLWLLLPAFGLSPHPVLCHKPDGRIVVETERGPGECRCEACLHSRDGHDHGRLAPERDGSTLNPLRCRHGRLPSESEMASAREARRVEISFSAALPRAVQAEGDSIALQAGPSPFESPPPGPLPETPALLRC